MTIWLAILLGIIQGACEFLPISSSGHLVLMAEILGINCNFIFFSLILHLATLFAVVFVLFKEIKFLFKNPFSPLAKKLYIATIPTILIVLIFKGFFENAFSGYLLPLCFMLTAVLLIVTEILTNNSKNKPITYKKSIIIGIAQGIAVLPGISRSGATIATAILCGSSREEASKFSFLMSIPIIFASLLYELYGQISTNTPIFDTPILPTIVAFFTAFIVGILSVKFMLKAIQKIKLWWFSIYLIILSILALIF